MSREEIEDAQLIGKEIKGSLSTKVEAVVKALVKIQTLEPDAKSLVFSSWNGMLDLLADALTFNGINYASLHSQGGFSKNLQKFKVRAKQHLQTEIETR